MKFKRQPEGEDNNLQPSISANTSFLEFDEESTDENRYTCCHGGAITTEVVLYLNDEDRSIEALHRFPTVKKMFVKYNTPLPSSAPVEKLFSFAGIVNRSTRQNLSDHNFEMLVLKKANKK
ncbi:uncharacterized protein LOC118749757 [Rhagoletis pomonella]|uniref:uncharacterized protein LOC118749757 n=1 Tax=Rhagoletis pomonella TaxID=28610 RepID=UPI001782100C|nr:uncharacterized protein LOC118749757 [Rhagoletis pomonella]